MKLSRMVLCAGVLLIACSVQAASRFSLIPKDSDVIVRVSSVSGVTEALKTTSFGRLWNDPKFQEALGEYDLEKFLKESIFSDATEEERHLYMEEAKMLSGEVVFAANIAEEEFTLIAAISEEDFKRSQVIDRRLCEIEQNATVIHKDSYQGIDIFSHTQTGEDDSTSWQAFIDNTLLMSSSEEWLKKTITQIKKIPIKQKDDEQPTLAFRINIKSLLDKFVKETEADIAETKSNSPEIGSMMPEFSPTKIIDALGFSGLKTVTISMKLHEDRMVSQSLLAIEKPLKGILSMVDLTPSPIDLKIPYAPERIISYEVSRINLMALWQQIPQLLNEALPPQLAAQANGGLMMSSAMLGVDPGRDLIAHLDTQIIATYLDDEPEPKGMFFMRLKNEEALQGSLQKIFAETGMLRQQMGEGFKLEIFRDSNLYEFITPGTNTTFAFTAESGYLVMGSGDVVRQYLRAIDSNEVANQAFYKSRLYSELRKRVNSKSVGYSAMDIGKYVKVLLNMVIDNAALAGAGAMCQTKTGGNNPFPNFDMKKLPSADYMSKFFGASFGQVVPTPKGIKSNAIMYYEPMK